MAEEARPNRGDLPEAEGLRGEEPPAQGANEPKAGEAEGESRRRFLKSGALILGGLFSASERLKGESGQKLRYVKPWIETFTGSASYADEGGRPCGPPSPCRPIQPCRPDLCNPHRDLWD